MYYLRGLKAFNVLAALATGGLGVSGLEPACGLPYPTPGPPVCRGAAERRAPRDQVTSLEPLPCAKTGAVLPPLMLRHWHLNPPFQVFTSPRPPLWTLLRHLTGGGLTCPLAGGCVSRPSHVQPRAEGVIVIPLPPR